MRAVAMANLVSDTTEVPFRRFTEATIDLMYRFIQQGVEDLMVQNHARQIVRDCPWKDYWCFGNSLLQMSKRIVKFVNDPLGIERVQEVPATYAVGTGDCDDFSVLIAAWAGSIGFDWRLVTVKAMIDRETQEVSPYWSHVYPVLFHPVLGEWLAADAVVWDSTFGWQPEGVVRKVWPRP